MWRPTGGLATTGCGRERKRSRGIAEVGAYPCSIAAGTTKSVLRSDQRKNEVFIGRRGDAEAPFELALSAVVRRKKDQEFIEASAPLVQRRRQQDSRIEQHAGDLRAGVARKPHCGERTVLVLIAGNGSDPIITGSGSIVPASPTRQPEGLLS